MSQINVPNRFESLNATFAEEWRPLILPVKEDLLAFVRLREHSRVQNGGVLCFLLGPSGAGKTTAVYSASANLPDDFGRVCVVPPNVRLRDTIGWLTSNLPRTTGGQTTLVLFDGREVSDDVNGLKQMLSGLNQFLRQNTNCLFFWPTTDAEWHKTIRGHASTIGGTNFVPVEGDHTVVGPPKTHWSDVLDRILLQFDKTATDVGLASDLISSIATKASTVGEFLGNVGNVISERVAKTRELKQLPTLIFVVSSSGDVVGEANRIRRAGTQSLAAEPLLGYSPRSEAGKWWAARNENANHHLGYMLSLFQARLLGLSASTVVHSCIQHGASDLQAAAISTGVRADKGNAQRTVEASELYRFLTEEPIPEFTSGRKGGGPQDATLRAYEQIQSLSAKRHKAINRAICSLLEEHVTAFEVPDAQLEVATQDLITDAIASHGPTQYHLEFHHLSEANCGAARIASYVMEKIRTYSIYHQLIPR